MVPPRIEGAPQGLIDEVWDDCYRAVPHFDGGLVVDIGAGVGTFSAFAVHHGCRVVAVEPHLPSMRLLRRNVPDAIVVAFPAGQGRVSMREEGHGVQTFPGDDCPTVNLADLITEPVDVLKVDCEGCEYPLLIGADLSQVAYLAVEVHVWTDRPNDHGLGIRSDPMPGRPEELAAWVSRTHQVALSSIRVMEAGGYLFGTR